jgi:hypothetical protein
MTPKHTPGPWELQRTDDLQVVRKTGENTYRFIARCDSNYDTGGIHPVDGDIANARLIAAAPELLAIAKCLLKIRQGKLGEGALTDEFLLEIIAKAEGMA